MERSDEVTRFLRCGGMNCDCSCGKDGKVEDCLTWRVHGYVEKLEAKIPRWISVEERLPEELMDVLVYRDGCFAIARIIAGEDWTYSGIGGDPTHWMPLPPMPKED